MLFCRQMHTLLKAGVPIVRALAGLEESTQNPALNRIVGDIRDKLQAGQDLSVGMSAHPKVFSPFMVNMLRVGELTGRLDEVFLRLYEYLVFEKKIARRRARRDALSRHRDRGARDRDVHREPLRHPGVRAHVHEPQGRAAR